jgi:thiamine-phosphate pyrophosphorylase
MADADRPQLYLVTPPAFDPAAFSETLAGILDAVGIACLRLALASRDEDALGRAADALRAVAHERDVAVVIDSHPRLAIRHGLDGVHLLDGARSVRAARKDLGPDAIVGTYCAASRHDGMNAGEAGADYVGFGPVGDTALGVEPRAEYELFEWWSQMIEVPVVAEGHLTPDLVARLASVTDFLAIGEEIWSTADPVAALRALIAPLG